MTAKKAIKANCFSDFFIKLAFWLFSTFLTPIGLFHFLGIMFL